MRTNTPAIAKKSCSTTPDRSSKAQLFGRRSPPPPSRTYGRKSKIRSHPNTPSQPPIASTSSTPLPNNNPPAVSSSTRSNFHLRNLALDYEEPILIPATSSPSSNSMSSPSNSTSEAIDIMDSDDEDEPVFLSMKLPVPSEPTQVESSETLREARIDLENALQIANDKIKAFEDIEKHRNHCPCCWDVMYQPFIISCGHTFCKECLLRLSGVYIRAKMNLACPDCRAIQGRFTPIPNYASQQSVDDMLQSKGITLPTTRQALQWPLMFQSRPMSFPFSRRSGTYPISAPVFAPAPFPIAVDDDE
ncbi:hypothetical protein F5879DRAFT_994209 [Lentinula edodes]|nr:hypothetical protein F5879DRAFT_994209 [Lentinula edodes]